MDGYWDRLEDIKLRCEMLQRSPIDDSVLPNRVADTTRQQLLLTAEESLRTLMKLAYPVIWRGDKDDPTRPSGSVLSHDWDRLA